MRAEGRGFYRAGASASPPGRLKTSCQTSQTHLQTTKATMNSGAAKNKGKSDPTVQYVWGLVRVIDSSKSSDVETVYKEPGSKGSPSEHCHCLFCGHRLNTQVKRILYHVAQDKEGQMNKLFRYLRSKRRACTVQTTFLTPFPYDSAVPETTHRSDRTCSAALPARHGGICGAKFHGGGATDAYKRVSDERCRPLRPPMG